MDVQDNATACGNDCNGITNQTSPYNDLDPDDYYYYYYDGYDDGYYYYYGDYNQYVLEKFDFETVIQGVIRPVLVFVTAFANMFVMGYFACAGSKRTRTTNMLFVSISLSDTMTGLLLLPNSLYFYAGDKETLSLSWCRVFMVTKFYISPVFHTASIWQTVLLGAQRYVCICHPFKSRRICTLRVLLFSILVVYVFAAMLHMYHLLEDHAKSRSCAWEPERPCGKTCIYLWFCVIFQHILPCAILLVLTFITLFKLKQATQSFSANVGRVRYARERIITITAFVIVIVFLIPELPHGVYKLVLAINVERGAPLNVKVNHLIISVYEILLLVSFHANFWIYCLVMGEFRRALMRFITCKVLKMGPFRRRMSSSSTFGRSSKTSYKTRMDSIGSRHTKLDKLLLHLMAETAYRQRQKKGFTVLSQQHC